MNRRIVIDARESGTSTGRYVDKLIEHLHTLKPTYEVLVLTKAQRLRFMAEIAPSFQAIETSFEKFTLSEQIGLLRQIRALEPDLVHFSMVQQPVLYRGKTVTTMNDLTTLRFRNPSKNPIVFWARQQVYKWVNRRIAHKADALLTFTQFVKDDVVQFTGVSPSKITVTELAADEFDEPPKPVPGFEGKRFIMFNGRPLPHKNLRRIVEAFALLHPKHPDLYLMLAGKKNALQASYVELAEELGVGEWVVLTDWVTDGQLKWAMQHTVGYIWASLSEGFGLPPLEAMLNGAPVVSSNASCMPEVLGDAAHYFDPLNVQDMADKIAEVLDDPILREDLIDRGHQQIKKYSWRRMAEQTLAIYQNILSD